MPGISLDRIGKSFPAGWRGRRVPAVESLSLEVGADELVAIVGPSGCGKTTLLRLVAGLEAVDSGTIALGGRDATSLPAERRDVAMVFQSGALMPHLSVERNLAFPLRARGVGTADRTRRVGEVATMLAIDGLLRRRASELSGGERQRVALGRALVRDPACLLLDEPFAALDAPLRRALRAELRAIHRRRPRPTLHVTHDQEEALALGDRVAVMRGGRIEQVSSPQEVYERPATRFVATFVGPRGMNVLGGRLALDGGRPRFTIDGDSAGAIMTLPEPGVRQLATVADRSRAIGVRPEALTILRDGDDATDRLVVTGAAVDVQRAGDRADVVVVLDTSLRVGDVQPADGTVLAHVPVADAPPPGTRIRLAASRFSLFAADGAAMAHLGA